MLGLHYIMRKPTDDNPDGLDMMVMVMVMVRRVNQSDEENLVDTDVASSLLPDMIRSSMI